MQTTIIRQFSILVILCVFFSQVYSSFHDVTSKVGLESVDGILAAFGDFNGDKTTDIFVISKQGKQLEIFTWNEGTLKFSHFKTMVFPDRYVVNVAPGDFDGDGCMDVAITTQTSPLNVSNLQPKKVYISWGNNKELTNIKDSFAISQDLKDQPAIVDVNGDLLPDLFGTIYNKDNASLEQRTYWVSIGKNRSFVAQAQTANITTSDGKTRKLSLNPVKVPQSNGFLDLTGDMTADIFVTTKKDNKEYKFEIWKNEDGVLKYLSPDISLPELPNKATAVHVGQSAFADFDGDGKIDHILPICLSEDCDKSAIYLYSNNKWSQILINDHPKIWQLIPLTSNDSIPNIPLMTIRIGDYNMDGYPDGLIILHVLTSRGSTFNRIPVLLENVPCSGGESCANGRTFALQWKSMTSLEGAVVATFYDMFENGVTDFVIVTESKGKFHLHAIRNDLYLDASFLKVMVLGGVIESCSSDKLPYGVNQAGPFVRYSITDKDGNLKTGSAAQLSQSSYFSLQCPYIVFGLGRAPNFVDKLSIGMPRAKGSPLRTHTWPSIIPNSQMIIIPYPPDSPYEWKSKLLVTPSKLVLLTALCLLGICVLLAFVIVALHLIEKRADQKEKREDAHKFHFDAM